MKLYSAPLQGFTEAVWRNVHSSVFGGIDGYFTPFLRYEHGEIRSKDIRDVERKNNTVPNLVPQIIAATPQEMHPLMELVAREGYNRVDINMGCSFPLEAGKKHGAGLLPHPDMVAALLDAAVGYKDFAFSVKMRLGWESKEEWRALLPALNSAPLEHIAMHPRLGVEQYKKPADVEAFAEFLEACKHPVIYNGDVTSLALEVIAHCFRLVLATGIFINRFSGGLSKAVGTTYGIYGVVFEAQLYVFGIELYILVVDNALSV